MNRRNLLALALAPLGAAASPFTAPLRSRAEAFRGSGQWEEFTFSRKLETERSALVLCDLWDRHWCRGATERVAKLVPRVATVVDRFRQRGILVVHAPSDTMKFYEDSPERRAIQALQKAELPTPRQLADPPLPIDDSDGGCDTDDKQGRAWSRQHPGIAVKPGDYVSDKGEEIYSAMKLRGITTLFVAGVHTNMCILNRSFAIRQMTKWGVQCILIRDLTDAMYDPKDRPFVSHERGTELVIEHIEKYWAPTTTSAQLLEALR